MTPAEHATAATTELATDQHSIVEDEYAALRAQAHAILAGKAGTGTHYANAEAALVLAATPTGDRHTQALKAIAYAHLAD